MSYHQALGGAQADQPAYCVVRDKGIIAPVDQNATSRQFDLANVKKVVLIQELLEDGYTLDAAAAKVNARLERISSTLGLLSFTREDIFK